MGAGVLTGGGERVAPVTLTEAAIRRISEMLGRRGKPSFGIRIGVRSNDG